MRKRWVGCWGSLFFFRKGGAGGGGKRIVPSSRLPADQGNTNINNNNNNVFSSSSVSHSLLPPPLDPSLLAPPSSPASFTHSALPSTAQSPNSSFLSLSANSPGGPSSAIYATGPYAHEHQLVSPPVLSTFTTEPSTAPLTPPPELAHLTTPSSPDVPFAQFLSSNHHHHKGKTNYDLQAAYSLYPPSPPGSSGLISPGDFVSQWDPSFSPQNSSAYPRTRSGRFFAHDTNPSSPMGVTASQDSNFFCPATFAQFYLDHAQETNPSFPHSGGRLSLSRESDTGNGHQNNKQQHNNNNNKSSKQDAEEIEAYRASFGFSADEIITTPHYLEISDVLDDSSFTITPFTSSSYKDKEDDDLQPPPELTKAHEDHTDSHLLNQESSKLLAEEEVVADEMSPKRCSPMKGDETQQGRNKGTSSRVLENGVIIISDEEDIFAKMKLSKKYHMGSSSDAEIDYRRIGSSREGKGKRKDTYLKY